MSCLEFNRSHVRPGSLNLEDTMNSLEKIEQALDKLSRRINSTILMNNDEQCDKLTEIVESIQTASAYLGDGAVDTACGLLAGRSLKRDGSWDNKRDWTELVRVICDNQNT